MKIEKELLKHALNFFEAAVVFLGIFDFYIMALGAMFFSIILLITDIFHRFLEDKDEMELFKKYFSFPVFVLAFYLIFPTGTIYGTNFALLLAGYAFLRVFQLYVKNIISNNANVRGKNYASKMSENR